MPPLYIGGVLSVKVPFGCRTPCHSRASVEPAIGATADELPLQGLAVFGWRFRSWGVAASRPAGARWYQLAPSALAYRRCHVCPRASPTTGVWMNSSTPANATISWNPVDSQDLRSISAFFMPKMAPFR